MAPLEAETTSEAPAFLGGESLRMEEEEEEEEEKRGVRLSGRELARERADEGARRSMMEKWKFFEGFERVTVRVCVWWKRMRMEMEES